MSSSKQNILYAEVMDAICDYLATELRLESANVDDVDSCVESLRQNWRQKTKHFCVEPELIEHNYVPAGQQATNVFDFSVELDDDDLALMKAPGCQQEDEEEQYVYRGNAIGQYVPPSNSLHNDCNVGVANASEKEKESVQNDENQIDHHQIDQVDVVKEEEEEEEKNDESDGDDDNDDATLKPKKNSLLKNALKEAEQAALLTRVSDAEVHAKEAARRRRRAMKRRRRQLQRGNTKRARSIESNDDEQEQDDQCKDDDNDDKEDDNKDEHSAKKMKVVQEPMSVDQHVIEAPSPPASPASRRRSLRSTRRTAKFTLDMRIDGYSSDDSSEHFLAKETIRDLFASEKPPASICQQRGATMPPPAPTPVRQRSTRRLAPLPDPVDDGDELFMPDDDDDDEDTYDADFVIAESRATRRRQVSDSSNKRTSQSDDPWLQLSRMAESNGGDDIDDAHRGDEEEPLGSDLDDEESDGVADNEDGDCTLVGTYQSVTMPRGRMLMRTRLGASMLSIASQNKEYIFDSVFGEFEF
jgi:hypothetical protein